MERAAVPRQFSLVRGGLVYSILLRLRLITPESLRAIPRAVLFALIAWVPLLALNLVASPRHPPVIPFLSDFATYGRMLLVLPLLIIAEPLVEAWLAPAAVNLVNGKLLSDDERDEGADALESSGELLRSMGIDLLLIVVAYALTVWAFFRDIAGREATWLSSGPRHLYGATPAGWWFLLVSGPMLQYLYCRWIWRFIAWARLLRKISRLDLKLVSTHGDSAGGLGHIGFIHVAFVPVVMAISLAAASYLANQIVHEDAPLTILQFPMVVLASIVLVALLTPLLFFTRKMVDAKRRDMMHYGELAAAYVQGFDRKWLPGGQPNEDGLLGTSDIQSLADLGSGVETVHTMRVVPFRLHLVLLLAAAAVLPILSLYLLRVPWKQAVAVVFRVLTGTGG